MTKERPRRKHTLEFKHAAVRRMMARGERSVNEIAAELDVNPNQLYRWRREFGDELGFGVRSAPEGERTAHEKENEELRRKLRKAEQERDFLKKAAAYFAKDEIQ